MIENNQYNTVLLETDDNLDILQIFSKYLSLYINIKKSENKSKFSIRNTNTALERFYDYIADELANNQKISIFDINKYFIYNYIALLEKRGLSISSQKLHLTIIKNFIVFIVDNDIERYKTIKTNLDGIKIKVAQKERLGFSQNDQELIKKLFKYLDNKNIYSTHKKSLMIKLLYFTGIRASELVSIKFSDILEQNDETHGLIYAIIIKGKGGKERFIYIQYDIIANNLEYIKTRNYNAIYLFETPHNNMPNTANIYIEIKNELQKHGIKGYGLHIFRHNFARNLVSKDINLATIKELLGHSSITTTAQFYAKSNENAKKRALFEKF
jgi:integrase/recombinase XerD